MPGVLVISSEPMLTVALARVVRRGGYDVVTARGPADCARAAPRLRPDVALIDRQLPDNASSELLQLFRASSLTTACVAISEPASSAAVLAAIRAGFCDWVDKPVNEEELLLALRRTTAGARTVRVSPAPDHVCDSHASVRLAEKVVLFVDSPVDGATLREFGRIAAISSGGLRNWCRTAGIGSRDFLRFARGLRAAYVHERDPSTAAEDVLDVVDRRTLIKFVAASGGIGLRLPQTVDDYLRLQRFVAKPMFARAVRKALSRHGTSVAPPPARRSRAFGGRSALASAAERRRDD